jgi:excisionase family DNA binding protein
MSEMPLNTRQAALIAGKHQRTIVAWIRRKELRAMKLPGKRGPYLINKADLLELIKIKYTPKPYNPEGDGAHDGHDGL